MHQVATPLLQIDVEMNPLAMQGADFQASVQEEAKDTRDVSPHTQSLPVILILLSGLGRNVFNCGGSLVTPLILSSNLSPPLLSLAASSKRS